MLMFKIVVYKKKKKMLLSNVQKIFLIDVILVVHFL